MCPDFCFGYICSQSSPFGIVPLASQSNPFGIALSLGGSTFSLYCFRLKS